MHIWAGAKTSALHHDHLESFIYVLKGKARMRWGEKLEITAEAGRETSFLFHLMDPIRRSMQVLTRSSSVF
jgi:uncharacterized RmlC-like cupin family protein